MKNFGALMAIQSLSIQSICPAKAYIPLVRDAPKAARRTYTWVNWPTNKNHRLFT
jgi:hypothetical protein